jgi:hypothetical protein
MTTDPGSAIGDNPVAMNRDQRLSKFRLRLLAAFGIGMVPGLFYSDEVVADEQTTECYTANEGETCLDAVVQASEVLSRLAMDNGGGTDDGCEQRTVTDEIVDETDPTNCCYTIHTDTSNCEDLDTGPICSGCYGRPYVADTEVVSAPTVVNQTWGSQAAPSLVPELAGLTPEQRAALAEFWSDNARAEHSSVAGFHRICLELIAHGAPLELLERSQKAAADELAHARVCYALASHYAGEPLGPGPMPIGNAVPIAATLVELAVATAREGCLAETSAAWLASELAEQASDPAVRAALEQIAREEAEHAELSWMTLRWTIETGGAEVREAIAKVFAAARPVVFGGPELGVHAHGMLAANEVQAIVERGFRELLVPVMRALAA